jgi:hypothetical protein
MPGRAELRGNEFDGGGVSPVEVLDFLLFGQLTGLLGVCTERPHGHRPGVGVMLSEFFL